MRGKLLLLLGVLFFSQVTVAEIVQGVKVPSPSEKVEFEPQYNSEIRKEKLESLDKDRIDRLRKEYSLDWYFEYCGDPRDSSEREGKKCQDKLNNLTDLEEKSLIVYKTNFLAADAVDPRLKKKVFEIIEDVRDSGDNGKYGRQSEFVYSPDVMFGIIFMEQTHESLAEYKWAYAKVRYLYDDELSEIGDDLNARERVHQIIESSYEKERLMRLEKKYNLEILNQRCGIKDYSSEFEYCGEGDGEVDLAKAPVCVANLHTEMCNVMSSFSEYYFRASMCVCKPRVQEISIDFSVLELVDILMVFYNSIYPQDYRYQSFIHSMDESSSEEMERLKKDLGQLDRIKDILLGYLVTMEVGPYANKVAENLKINLLMKVLDR